MASAFWGAVEDLFDDVTVGVTIRDGRPASVAVTVGAPPPPPPSHDAVSWPLLAVLLGGAALIIIHNG